LGKQVDAWVGEHTQSTSSAVRFELLLQNLDRATLSCPHIKHLNTRTKHKYLCKTSSSSPTSYAISVYS